MFATEKRATGITNIVWSDTLGDSPAKCHRGKGLVWLNSKWKGKLPEDIWFYIITHEEGHIVNQNNDELQADAYASKKYLEKYGRTPSRAVLALSKILPDTPQTRERIQAQLQRSQQYDCMVNQHSPACRGGQLSAYNGNSNEISYYATQSTIQQKATLDNAIQQAQLAASVAKGQLTNDFVLKMKSGQLLTKVELDRMEKEYQLEMKRLDIEAANAAAINAENSRSGLPGGKNTLLLAGGAIVVIILLFFLID